MINNNKNIKILAFLLFLIIPLLTPSPAYAAITEVTASASTTLDQTTDTTINTMTTTPGAGDYLAIFNMEVLYDAAAGNNSLFVSIYVNGAQQAHTERQLDSDGSLDSGVYSISTHAYISVGASQVVDVRYRVSGTPAMTGRDRALTLFPVSSADITQATATLDDTLNSSTYTQLGSMTATPGAGDYLLVFSTSAKGPDLGGGEILNFAVFVNDSIVQHSERTMTQESSNVNNPFPVLIAAKVSPGAGQTVEIRWKNSGTAGIITSLERTMTLVKVDTGELFEANSQTDSTGNTNTTDARIDSMVLTPGAGEYLAIFSSSDLYGTISVNSSTLYSFYVNGSQVAATERQFMHEESIDSADIPAFISGEVNPGAAQDVEVKWRGDTSTARDIHERTFILIQEPTAPTSTPTPTPTSTPTSTPTPPPTSIPTHTNSNFSLSAWVNPNSSIATKAISVKNSEIRLVTDASGNPLCQITNNASWQTAATSATALSLNAWQHVACTYDKQTLRVFVNGVLTGSQSLTVAIDNTSNNWRFGSDQGGTYGDYNGKLDDVRIYNYTRTPGQIIEDMNAGHPAPGSPIGSAVGHWRFDEGALNTCSGGANDFCDSSDNTNDLVYSTTTGGISNTGKFGKAYSGADNTRITRADDADFDFANGTDDFSLSVWFNRGGAISNLEYLLDKRGATTTNDGYTLYMDSDGDIVCGIGDGAAAFPEETIGGTLSKNYDEDAWHHAVCVKLGTSSLRLYVDGKEIASDTSLAVADDMSNDGKLILGDANETDGTDEWLGDVDEVKIFRSALTADQVKTLYNQSSGVVWGALSTNASGVTDNSSERSYCPPGDTTATCSPIGEWKFDENTGTTSVYDTSGNGNTGTMNGSMTADDWVPGKVGSALDFDGSDDYISAGSSSFDPSASDFTISVWAFPRSSALEGSAARTLFAQQDGTGTGRIWLQITNSNTTWGSFLAGSTKGSGVTVVLNTWANVVLVHNNSADTLTWYINGVQGNTNSTVAVESATGNFIIGAHKLTTVGRYDGLLDDIRLYNYARTQAQIAWDYNRGAPVAHYKFDECTGATAYNSVKNGNGDAAGMNGTITPQSLDNTTVGSCSSGTATEVWNDGTNGKRNSAFGADGDDDYTTVSDNANLRFNTSTQDFSVFAWVKRASATSDDYIVSKEEAADDGWVILIDATNDLVTCSVNSTDVSSSSAITDTNWHHVGCTVDREGNGQVYIDGKANGSAVSTSGITMATTGAMSIGARGYTLAGTYFDGLIDDVKIFNYALTAQQIKTIMNQGAVSFVPITGSP